MYPNKYLYSEEHEWVHVEGDQCTLGITDYAQNELGEVVYVDLPEVGDTFDEGEEFGAIDSSKTSADVYTPVAGEVVEVNSELEEAPEKVNAEAHSGGWLIKIRMSSTDGLKGLMNAEQYAEFIGGQE